MGMPDATVVTFCYDERPCLNMVRSLIRDARRWPNLAIWDQSKDALITRMRSTAATHFLEQGAGDVLVMVDHDIGWEAGDLEHLVQVCLDLGGVVGGVYPKRGFGIGVPVRFGQYGEFQVPSDRVVECLYVATGFMAIHRSVLQALEPTLPMNIHGYRAFFGVPTVTHEDGRIEELSEDYDFCQKARAAGFQVWADLRPQLTHFGSHQYRVQDTQWKPPEDSGPATILAKDVTRPCDVPGFDGAPMQLWVDADDQRVSGELIAGRAWEPEVLTALVAELRPDDVVLEIGAHIGYHTVQIAKRCRRVVAVEPVSTAWLRRNVALHELENVDIWEMAMVHENDSRRTARMLRQWANPGASHLLDEDDAQGMEVDVCRLPDLPGPFDVIKVDAEGAEWLIFAGERSRDVLQRARLLVFEYCEAQLAAVSGVTGGELLDLIEAAGFETGITDRGRLPAGRGYCNILARRRE